MKITTIAIWSVMAFLLVRFWLLVCKFMGFNNLEDDDDSAGNSTVHSAASDALPLPDGRPGEVAPKSDAGSGAPLL